MPRSNRFRSRPSIRGLESYAVKCGEEIYVYVVNPLFERAYRFESRSEEPMLPTIR